MNKTVLISTITALLIVVGGLPVFAEEVNITYNGHPLHGIKAKVHDPHDPIKTKDKNDLKGYVGGEIEGAVVFTDNLRLDIAGKKDVIDTSFGEGWEGEVMVVGKKTFIDFRDLFSFKEE